MTTSSEEDTIQAPESEAEGAAGGNLDKVRDLLFGGQMRDYDRKFARLEERLIRETAELRDDVKKRLAGLEAYMKAEVESLSERLRSEQDSRTGADQEAARGLRETAQQFGQKVSQLDDLIARGQRDLRQQLHAQHQELGDDIRQRVEDVLVRLAQEAQELRSDKTDRKALAALLTEMAMRLNGDVRALAPGDEVRVSTAAARPDDSPPGPGDPRAAQFRELRSLLVGPEQRQLRTLQTRLEDPAAQARDVGRVLATAVELRSNDPHLRRALAPTIEETLSASVRRNPRPLADALFPIIGPAIRKAIAATLNGMLESLNTTLEHSLSWRSIRWRLDARRTGKSFAEIVLLNTLVYRVEQVFLIHRPSGLLLEHLTAAGTAVQDADLVSGMLTAIRDFVQDSFNVSSDEGLQTLKVGDLSVWIEQGPHALVAVVVRGSAPAALRATLQQALESVQAQYSDLLEAFDGNTARFEGARPLLEACLQQQYRARDGRDGDRPSRLSPTVRALALIAVLLLGAWLFVAVRGRLRWNAYIDALRAEPGVVVVSTGSDGGKYVVSGLRDPLGRDPEALLPQHRLAADAVTGRWELYQAMHPALVLARARRLLAPPAGTELRLQDGVLLAAGAPSVDWIENAVRLAPVIPGVTRFDASGPIDAAFRALASAIEAAVPMFAKGSTAFAAGGEQTVRDQAGRLASLDALGRAAGRRFAVLLVGEADADGAAEANLPLSENRAARVLSLLQATRLERITLTATGVGSPSAADAGAGEENKQRNRRVSFRVTAADRQ